MIRASELPPFSNQRTNFVAVGNTDDIIDNIHLSLPAAVAQVKPIAERFRGSDTIETARNIFNFLKDQITYRKDPEGEQVAKLPNALMALGGDCKSFSLFAAALLRSLNLPVIFRYAGYDRRNVPTHVYAVTENSNGQKIIIDPVYGIFNSEKPARYKKDFRMRIYTLSGVSDAASHPWLVKIKTALDAFRETIAHRPKMFETCGDISDQLQRAINDEHGIDFRKMVLRLSAMMPYIQNSDRLEALRNVIVMLKQRIQNAGAVSGIGRRHHGGRHGGGGRAASGAKKVALAVPRTAFLELVRLNVRGLASKLARAIAKDSAKVESKWKKLGGNFSKFQAAVNAGKTKKPLFGEHKPVNGIGDPVTLSAGLASAAAIIAALSPLLKSLGGKDGEGDPGVDALVTESGADTHDADVEALDPEGGSGFSANPMLLIGGAAVLALILFSKK